MNACKYNIILCDVPWSYRDKCHSGNRGAEYKYPTLSLEEIKRLDIDAIAAPDCALFFWATMPLLPEALEVIKAWGFNYKTAAFTWVKRNKVSAGWFWGMGNYSRSNSELCLLGMRGKLTRVSAKVHSLVEAPIGRHSSKPDEVRTRITALFGDLPRVELFARESASGWDSLGFGIDGRDIRQVLCQRALPEPNQLTFPWLPTFS
jgi:N6-adenosine-specific RNA methylase IME4